MPDKQPEQSQADKFRSLARELRTDDNEKAFEEKVRAVVKSQPLSPSGEASSVPASEKE